jgi:hypothetical protein
VLIQVVASQSPFFCFCHFWDLDKGSRQMFGSGSFHNKEEGLESSIFKDTILPSICQVHPSRSFREWLHIECRIDEALKHHSLLGKFSMKLLKSQHKVEVQLRGLLVEGEKGR